MVNWFSAMLTVGLSNIVLAWTALSIQYFVGAAICGVAALGSFYIAWREIDE